MEKKQFYLAPEVRMHAITLEPFCNSGGVPDYEVIEDFEWGD